jgi:RNA polymerase sigma-70 factor
MEQVSGLAATFLAHAKVRLVPPVDTAALERLLANAWETARERWPTVALPAGAFVTHLAERLPVAGSHDSIEPLLAQLSLSELYLACACVQGIPSAIELFDRNYIAKLPKLLRDARHPDALIEDVCQLTSVKLLVATPEGGPKIAEYKGQGALMSWVRVTASRIAIRLQPGEKPAREDEDADAAINAIPAPGVDPELDLIKRRHQAEFRQAVREAFGELSAEERHLLRLYVIERLSMYKLAALFRVNQSTISRWMDSVRQTIYEETQRRLQERLGLNLRDFKSFLAVLDSKFEPGLSRLLKEEGEPRPPGQD